jgi:hypothetical protein
MGLFRKSNDVLVCPKCGGTDKIAAGSMNTNHVPTSGFIGKPLSPAVYRCKGCDYEGTFFLIDKSELDDFRKKLK